MFGPISPKVKDLTQHLNTWVKDQTLANKAPASSSQNRISPATIWEGRGFSGGTTSIPVAYKSFVTPVAASPTYGIWKLQYSLNNSAYGDALTFNPLGASVTKPALTITGYGIISTDNASTVDTLLSLNVASTGNKNHIGMTYSGTTRAAWSSGTDGASEFRVAGTNATHTFKIGSSIGSQTDVLQISGTGLYNYGSSFNNNKLTAGSADTSVQTTLSSYGSLAVKGVLVTSSSYTLAETETMVYVDPSNSNFCIGTPVACTTYSNSTACNAHSGIGCSWYSGDPCSTFSSTDLSTCESGHAGCTWDSTSCSPGNNTDSTTCESQDDTYGGNCTWDTTTCPAFTNTSTCNAQVGCNATLGGDCTAFTTIIDCQSQSECTTNQLSCTAFTDTASCSAEPECTLDNSGDCGTLSDGGGDGTACATQPECSYDSGSGTCSGTYFISCTGNYLDTCTGNYFTSCDGNLCTGNYYNGNCSGTYGAYCQGGAGNCGLITSSGPCTAESGCSWSTGVTVTLPYTANASRGTTGRIYSIMHVGSTGTASIVGQSGQPVFQYTTLNLLKKGDKVLLHNQNISFPCSLFTTQTPCSAQSGCTWLVVCSTLGDQSSCEAAQCAWNGDTSTCEGRTTAVCSGTYSNGSHWYAHSLERGYSVVEKTASYTLTDIDDMVVVTANSVTLTLPSAPLNNGKQYVMKNFGSGTVTLNTTSSQTIDGNASGTLTLATGESINVMSNNSNWYIL